MKHRRGLTLLEVLLAVAILSLLAGTCIPLLRTSFAVLHETPPEIRLDELAALADAILDDPKHFGIEKEALEFATNLQVPWPDHPSRPVVVIRCLNAPVDADHAWLTFTSDGWTVSRWMAVKDEDSSDANAGENPGAISGAVSGGAR